MYGRYVAIPIAYGGRLCYTERKRLTVSNGTSFVMCRFSVFMIRVLKSTADTWELDVLGVPFGSPTNRDAHGEYFSSVTQFHADQIPLPPVVYYHGYTPDGQPQSAPEFIGRTTHREVRPDGVWYRVVLDQANRYAQRVWDAAKRGIARASSGTMEHLRRATRDGHITTWLVAELSLFDIDANRQPANRYAVALPVTKSLYHHAGIPLPKEFLMSDTPETITLTPDQLAQAIRDAHTAGVDEATTPPPQPLTPEELRTTITNALKTDNRPVVVTPADLQTYMQQAQQAAVEEMEERLRSQWVVGNRLPVGGGAPAVLKMTELAKFDHMSPGDLAILVGILESPHSGAWRPSASAAAVKALAIKFEEMDGADPAARSVKSAMKAAGITNATKANEIIQTGAANYGANWVGHAYSTILWQDIRHGTPIADMLPQQEVPQGSNVMTFPLEGTDATWYRVAEATSADNYDGTTKTVTPATIDASPGGTGSRDLRLKKLGARQIYTGEMDEDSLIPIAGQLRQQLATSGAENLEHAIIDGDVTVSAATNINSSGTPTTQVYTLFDGFRHAALVDGGAATSRSNAAVIGANDFLLTAQKLGGGLAAIDPTKIAFIMPMSLHWKVMGIAEILTADKVANPTIDGGMITRIFGIPLYTSAQMLRASATRLAQANGTIHDTAGNNITTQLLCVRPDQWVLGWRRRMLIETNRIPSADATEIVATMRVGLVFRNSLTAAALTYNILMSAPAPSST